MPVFASSFAHRSSQTERMDDLSIGDARLERALHEIRYVNRFLSGYRALRRALEPVMAARVEGRLDVLDVGCGLADYAVEMIRWGTLNGVSVHVTALDANPGAITYAREYVHRHLPERASKHVEFVIADALELPFPNDAFHVTTASLFLHHFTDPRAVCLLREMDRTATLGIVVNDLHRHGLAYAGIRSLAAALPVSDMFRHDGPLSVRRAFKPSELAHLGEEAGLESIRIHRHWPYRLTLSTLCDSASVSV